MKKLRFTAMVLCVLTLLTIGVGAYAATKDPDVMPLNTYIDYVAATLRTSGSTATAAGQVSPYNNEATRVAVKLQQYIAGGWKTQRIWYGSSSGGTSEAGGTYTMASGYNYRVQVNGRVVNSSGTTLESVTTNSAVKYYG